MSSLFAQLVQAGGEGGVPTYETHHWLLPETAEIIYGGIASVLVFFVLGKFALPMMKKSLSDRTARIQADIDNAKNVRETAEAEASRIRTALGDINSERARILAEADAQAATIVSEGRARIDAEMADVEAKALADIATAAGRAGDELKAEISRLSAIAVEQVVARVVDDRVRQDLVENFISNVGAGR